MNQWDAIAELENLVCSVEDEVDRMRERMVKLKRAHDRLGVAIKSVSNALDSRPSDARAHDDELGKGKAPRVLGEHPPASHRSAWSP